MIWLTWYNEPSILVETLRKIDSSFFYVKSKVYFRKTNAFIHLKMEVMEKELKVEGANEILVMSVGNSQENQIRK